jgi:adenine-specific DNA-methyltransferase
VANLSKIKRERMLEFLESLKAEHTDDKSIRAFTEIENQLRDKKYGLVWEEHTEHVDKMLEDNIPIFTEDKDRKIVSSADDTYNFLLEGDNLQCLYLLEKTHMGAVDIIYIDPPYNTGNKDFIYNDCYIESEDSYKTFQMDFVYRKKN